MNTSYAPPTGRWGLWDIGWFVLVVIGTVVASALLLIPVALVVPDVLNDTGVDGSTAAGAWIVAVSQLLFFAGMASWPLITGTWKADGWRRAFGFVVTWRAVWMGLVGGIVTLVAMTVLTSLTAELLGRDINSAGAEVAATMTGSTAAYALFLALIAVGAPFVEEISFRGLVWGAVVKRGWSPWLATLAAALPFALLHVEPLRVAPLLAAGLVLGTVRQFGGLGASMLGHAVVNVIGVIGILSS
ncbi:MAG: type II CAAX prenyl endopeptidase Rce1 family protein [Actinomycetes bacterium]